MYINEFRSLTPVKESPYGILSAAVNVKNIDEIDVEGKALKTGLVSSYVADWSKIDDFDNATKVYVSPVKQEDVEENLTTFQVVLESAVSTVLLGRDYEYLNSVVERMTKPALQKSIESQVWSIIAAKNPTSVSASQVSSRRGVALLESKYAAESNGERGVIHAPREHSLGLRPMSDNDVLYDDIGTPIVAGSGYPIASGNIYMTGPMTVYVSKPLVLQEVKDDSASLRKNTAILRVGYSVGVSFIGKPFAAWCDTALDFK